MKKFLLSTLLFIGGILGSIQAEGPVFQWAKSLDGNPGNGGDNAHSLIKSSDRKILALAQFGSMKDNDPVYYGDALRKVLIPELMPGIATGAVMAFTMSFDDFVISFFSN